MPYFDRFDIVEAQADTQEKERHTMNENEKRESEPDRIVWRKARMVPRRTENGTVYWTTEEIPADPPAAEGRPSWRLSDGMTQAEVDDLPPAQRQAMHDLQKRSGIDWPEFLRKCDPPCGVLRPYVSVHEFHGMFIGIEPDGYTHS
jgi:hypothetical protein